MNGAAIQAFSGNALVGARTLALCRAAEVARILRELADRVAREPIAGRIKLYDLNGNPIGFATLE